MPDQFFCPTGEFDSIPILEFLLKYCNIHWKWGQIEQGVRGDWWRDRENRAKTAIALYRTTITLYRSWILAKLYRGLGKQCYTLYNINTGETYKLTGMISSWLSSEWSHFINGQYDNKNDLAYESIATGGAVMSRPFLLWRLALKLTSGIEATLFWQKPQRWECQIFIKL